jgi:hypothetical protein
MLAPSGNCGKKRGLGMKLRVKSIVVTLAAFAALATLVFGVTSAPAGNRDPVRTLVETPGPAEISYGENVGYTATLFNNQSSTFTKVIYRHLVPTTKLGGVSTPASLVYSSCEPGRTSWPAFAAGSWYACPELSQLPSGASTSVLLVWKAPGIPTAGDGVSCGAVNDCVLGSRGEFTIKEGTGNPGSSGPDTFAVGPVETPLYAASTDLTKARGYVLNACSTGSSLETSVVTPVGPGNKLYTKVCASTVPGATGTTGNPLDPGLVVEIEEKAGGPITEDVTICIPVPGDTCADVPPYTPWTFTPKASFTFTIDIKSLPRGEKVDRILHDDGSGTGFVDVTADCTINVINSQKIAIVTCASSKNGEWRFG